jgi:hypothetical protein
MLSRSIKALHDYKANRDPLAVLANTVALVVAGNQPFYPLYLHAIVGRPAWPAWITLLTTPLFAAVPAIAKRNSLAGRAMLPTIGTVNAILAGQIDRDRYRRGALSASMRIVGHDLLSTRRTARHARRVGLPVRRVLPAGWVRRLSARIVHRRRVPIDHLDERVQRRVAVRAHRLRVSIYHGT